MGEKSGLKKGAWSSEEDELLSTYINTHGHCTWSRLPQYAGLNRCGKSCRLRWMNYLRPNLKRGAFTREDEELIVNLHAKLGTSWSKIAASLPGRSDNEIKNHWHAHLKEQPKKKTKEKKAKSVPKPRHRDDTDFVILESSSVTPQKSRGLGNVVASMKNPVPDKQNSEMEAFVWPDLKEMEAWMKVYNEIVISAKPDSEFAHKDDITSVLNFPESPQKAGEFTPPSIDDFITEIQTTDETVVLLEPSLQSDEYMIDVEVPVMESMAINQTAILSDLFLDIDPDFSNDQFSVLYQDSGFGIDL